MKTIRNAVFTSVAAGLLNCAIAIAKPVAPAELDAWSKPVSGLSGRMRVAQPKITTDQHFQLTLELANRGGTPLAVQSGNPHIFSVTVLGSEGKPMILRRGVLTQGALPWLASLAVLCQAGCPQEPATPVTRTRPRFRSERRSSWTVGRHRFPSTGASPRP